VSALRSIETGAALRCSACNRETGGDRRARAHVHGGAVGGSGAARASRRASRSAARPLPDRGAGRGGEGPGGLSAAAECIEPIVGWRTWLVVPEGEGPPPSKRRLQRALVPAQRARRTLFPPATPRPGADGRTSRLLAPSAAACSGPRGPKRSRLR